MKRGDFLKLSCTGCLLSAAGLAGVGTLLEGCSPKSSTGGVFKTAVADKAVRVPLDQISQLTATVVRAKGVDYDIAVHPVSQGKWEALLLRCTHFSNPLVVNGQEYSCPLHGSQFGAGGEVKRGPASRPLQKLPCEIDGNSLVIHV